MSAFLAFMAPWWLMFLLVCVVIGVVWVWRLDRDTGPDIIVPRDPEERSRDIHILYKPYSFGTVKLIEVVGGAVMGYSIGFPWPGVVACMAITPVLLTIYPGTGTERVRPHGEQ